MTAPGPLAGIRILDLSRVLAGPWATQMLGDLGAEVIKVERPGAGDDTRGWGPPWAGDGEARAATYFLAANRNKRSVTIDLATEAGQALVRTLAAASDVVVENFKVGTLARYGLDHAALAAANPRIITCSITGFGQDGPRAAEPGYDLMVQAMAGLMSVTGEPDRPPQRTGVAVVDVMTGLHAAVAILAALRQRDAEGVGRHIDLALFDVALSTLANQSLAAAATGEPPARLGNAHPSIVPYQSFATADGHIIVAVGNDAQFARFAAVAGRPELAADPRFATNAMRVEHRQRLVPIVADLVARRTTEDWMASLAAAGIPAGPINDMPTALADRQAAHRGMVGMVAGVPAIASPLTHRFGSAPPALGADTDTVLRELAGLDEGAIAKLRDGGVI